MAGGTTTGHTRGAAPNVRPAEPGDLALLGAIERAAGAGFRDLGMDAVADDEPPPPEVLGGHQRAGRCWVVADDADAPVAYVTVDVVDAAAHVEQLSVHPRWARRRLGARLLGTVDDWAGSRGLAWVTLTTFADVPWNGPYYERLGFRVVAPAEQSAGLRRIRDEEAGRGLDRWPRVAMRRAVHGHGASG